MENLLLIFIGIIGFGSIFMANVINKHIKEIAQLKEQLKENFKQFKDEKEFLISGYDPLSKRVTFIEQRLNMQLYEIGNTVYFYDYSNIGNVKELKGKIIDVVINPNYEPDYKIKIGKKEISISQKMITAWE